MERWVEHYLELHSTKNVVTDLALNSINGLLVKEHFNKEPTMEELSKAVDCLTSGKAPASDGIYPEIIKGGKPVLLQPLHDLTSSVFVGRKDTCPKICETQI